MYGASLAGMKGQPCAREGCSKRMSRRRSMASLRKSAPITGAGGGAAPAPSATAAAGGAAGLSAGTGAGAGAKAGDGLAEVDMRV